MMEPRAYLAKFYSEMDPGSQALMRFFASTYRSFHTERMLEFGGGPTLYSLISAVKCVDMIHFTDHSRDCIVELERWIHGDQDAFDWTIFIREALGFEFKTYRVPSRQAVQRREHLIRSRSWKFSYCDAFSDDPLLGSGLGKYGIVATNFCLEGITNEKNVWVMQMEKLANLVEYGGVFVTVALAHATGWTVSDYQGPAVFLELADLEDVYKALGFSIIQSQSVALSGRTLYDGFHMISGRRPVRSDKHG